MKKISQSRWTDGLINSTNSVIFSTMNTYLQKPTLNQDEAPAFRVHTKAEIADILRDISRKIDPVAIYYNQKDFILTSVLRADESGVWLDVGPSRYENSIAAGSANIDFVSSHHKVKIHFSINQLKIVSMNGKDVFYAKLPEQLFRIQRREFFRVAATPGASLIIPTEVTSAPMKAKVIDISESGLSVSCPPSSLSDKSTLKNCRLEISEVGIVAVSVEVVNSAYNAGGWRRLGCRFINISSHDQGLIRRYMMEIQKRARALVD